MQLLITFLKTLLLLRLKKLTKQRRFFCLSTRFLKTCKVSYYYSLGLPHICKIYEFIESGQQNGLNFIVMQMLGKNLANLKKQKGADFTRPMALRLLVRFLCVSRFKCLTL